METEEISRKNTRGQVNAAVHTLGRRIANGTYAEGSTLAIEQDLAANLGVGRNALRETVKVLSGKGLLSTAPRSGTKVRPRDEWNMLDPDVLAWHADPDTATREFMLDLIELRHIIEPKAAELAAKRATREDISNILSAYDAMANCGEDLQKRIEADIEFHTAVLKASHNSVLTHFKHAISTYLRAHVKQGEAQTEEVSQADLERHYQIALAIASGEAKSACSLAKEMLNLNRRHFD
ncbi:FadR/GntR family transcriptional regulator [Microbulbifer sp. 2201CG32-9]|uniref:FadR/GntR family transcriptional regulator n=1 Tax=unclassified Microbulbifer TaxID=2619833 RepID=UPI00345C09D1